MLHLYQYLDKVQPKLKVGELVVVVRPSQEKRPLRWVCCLQGGTYTCM